MRDRLARWLDLRPTEVRTVALSALGAFLALGFLVLVRSLREALYLTRFAVETLPYVTGAVALLSVPVAGLFARALARGRPQRAFAGTVVGVGLGIGALAPLLASSDVAVVVFYLWTALSTMVVTSGFWLITAELFPIRGAKRVFGLIGAGGTAGAMVSGNVLALASGTVGVVALVPMVLAVLALFLIVQSALPRPGVAPGGVESEGRTSVRQAFRMSWSTPHLRTIALIVAVSTVASTLVDYQFKDFARASIDTSERLAGFFGAFYGWTGAIALIVQLFLSARLLSRAGIAVTLAVLPTMLLLGAGATLFVPTLLVATLVRGADNSLRKSLHRAGLELLYIPIPARVRRRTKTFVDSVADSAAEGFGALLIFVVVTLAGLPSRWLSVLVGAGALGLLVLARESGRSYARTVARQLRDRVRDSGGERALLDQTFSDLDIRTGWRDPAVTMATRGLAAEIALARAVIDAEWPAGEPPRDRSRAATAGGARLGPVDRAEMDRILRSGDTEAIRRVLDDEAEWTPEWVVPIARLLARDRLYRLVSGALARQEEIALAPLAKLLRDPDTEFAIRRRIPAVLAEYESVEADDALLEGIAAPRFEVRYRAAIGLLRRRRLGYSTTAAAAPRVWAAVRAEVSRERPVWELQRLLDDDPADDNLAASSLGSRGALSLEHTFRLLTMVLDPEAVSSAFRGLTSGDEHLRSLALEYLEQSLPEDISSKLWPFVGDHSEHRRARDARPIDQVISDLVTTDATYIVSEEERRALRDLLSED